MIEDPVYANVAEQSLHLMKRSRLESCIWVWSSQDCVLSGLTEGEVEEGKKAKEDLELDQGEDGEDGDTGRGKKGFATHMKKSEVSSIHMHTTWSLSTSV